MTDARWRAPPNACTSTRWLGGRRPNVLQGLVAVQLVLIAATGVTTAARLDVFSPIDEGAHFDYVQKVAEEHRLPVLGRDKVSPEVAAFYAGADPDARRAIDIPPGLEGESYEAFQPPLYYVVASPIFLLAADFDTKVTLLRLFDLVLLMLAAAVVYRLGRLALPDAHLLAFSVALSVLLWPGVMVRAVTVSNAALELLLACSLVYALWRAWTSRGGRWLLVAGALLGLGLLAKLTFLALAPLVLGVAARHALQGRDRRSVLAAAATLVIPLLLIAPWLAFNYDHYAALTANGLAREMQEGIVNPDGVDYTLGRFGDQLPHLLDGFLPDDWGIATFQAPLLVLGFDFLKVALFGLPALLLLVEPRWLRTRHAALLITPLVLGVAQIAYVTLAENWPLFQPRYLYPAMAPFAIFAALSWRRLLRSERAPVVLAAACTVVLALAWLDLVGRFLVPGLKL